MIFNLNKIPLNTIREKRFFAFFPITIGPITRWLEFVKVKQIRSCGDDGSRFWFNMQFLDINPKSFKKYWHYAVSQNKRDIVIKEWKYGYRNKN